VVSQAIYAQLDKQMDGRGRPLGGLHNSTTDTDNGITATSPAENDCRVASADANTRNDMFDLDDVYEPDYLYTEDGKRLFDFGDDDDDDDQ
jgi:hypothetical protein